MLTIIIIQLLITRRDREQVFGQITTIVNTTICHDESLDCRLVFDTWVVKTRVQHDD